MHRHARLLVLSILLTGLFVSPLLAEKRIIYPNPPESHRRLANGIEDLPRPEEALAQRLNWSRQIRGLKNTDDALNSGLRKLAKKLLADEDFVKKLKGMSREDLDQLRNKVRNSNLPLNDKGLSDLFRQGSARSGSLSPADADLLNQWKQKLGASSGGDSTTRPFDNQSGQGRTQEPDQPPRLPNSPRPPPLPFSQDPARSPDWLKNGLDVFVKDLDKWIETPAGKSWTDTIKKLARRAEANTTPPSGLGTRATRLGEWMTKVTGVRPNIQTPRIGTPTLPRLGSPSSMTLPGATALADFGKVFIVLACFGVAALIFWRGRDWVSTLRAMVNGSWRLGPWPVRPDEISTRGDLVRAFEYLALLCLGPTARTCNHLELGQRIGSQPALDPQRRREAADTVARLYEQARYTPDEERLPSEDIRRARRELAYLAGTAAV